jgi:hypothetical protein
MRRKGRYEASSEGRGASLLWLPLAPDPPVIPAIAWAADRPWVRPEEVVAVPYPKRRRWFS